MPLPRPARSPDPLVTDQIGAGEHILHVDRPALDSLLVRRWKALVLMTGAIGALGWSMTSDQPRWVQVACFLVADLLLLRVLLRRLQELCTRYVVTDRRVLVVSGVLSRRQVSVPLIAVTDVTCRQSPLGRVLGYATVSIEVAHQRHLRHTLTGLREPRAFQDAVFVVLADHLVRSNDPHTRPYSPVAPLR